MKRVLVFICLQLFSMAAFCQFEALVLPTAGDEREFLAIDRLKVEAGWSMFSKETRTLTGTYAVPKGWVILEIRVVVHKDDHGTRNTEGLSDTTNVVLESEIIDFYDNKIRAAATQGDQNLVAEFEQKRDKHLKLYNSYRSNTNFVRATVAATGHGAIWNRRRSIEDISVSVKCMYIGVPG